MSTQKVSGTTSATDVASTSVMSRIPEFWRDQPRLWFTQFEAVVAPQKQGDDTKYNLVIAKLSKEELIQVSDILASPPEANKYIALKERLITCFEESEQQQFQRLLSGMELGDQKPSQLLRKMRDLARGKMNDDTIRIMWLRLLPSSVTTVLAVSDEQSIEKLSAIADKIIENSRLTEVSAVNTNNSELHNSLVAITAQLAKIQLDVFSLQNQQHRRSNYRNFDRRSRHYSRSRSRDRSQPRWRRTNNLCFYHNNYGNKAIKCEKPCAWMPKTQTPEN